MKARSKDLPIIHRLEDIPQFASLEEEGAFWDTHQLSPELMDQLPAVRLRFGGELAQYRREQQAISLTLQGHIFRRIKQLAAERGVPYQTMLKLWIAERLEQEECHRATFTSG